MLRRNMMLKYYQQANPEGGDGGGASTQEPKTYTQEELDNIVAGLKAKNDELINEKRTSAQRAQEAEDARIAAEQEAAKKSGELDKFEASLRGEFDKERSTLTEQLDALKSQVTGSSKNAVLNAMAGEFIAPESIEVISTLVKTEFDGQEVKTQFTDFAGNVITTDPAEFKKWMGNHPAISHLMKADGMTGGGANGSKSSGGAADFANMTLTEKAKLANENPKLYAQLSAQT